MKPIEIPVVGIGPGSQPAETDGATLDYLVMPREMDTYTPTMLPEPEAVVGLHAGMDKLRRLHDRLAVFRVGAGSEVIDLSDLDVANRSLVDQALGEGEVSVRYAGPREAHIQETRLAGVWRVQMRGAHGGLQRDTLEIADIPALVRHTAFDGAREHLALAPEVPDGVLNAPPVLVELLDRSAAWRPGQEAHVVNLTLLPQTEADLAYLQAQLGQGPVTLLSRGYGNCRISATGLAHVWWVQHFNSEDKLILDTLVVTDVPAEALAAQEDIEDSAARLAEILDALT